MVKNHETTERPDVAEQLAALDPHIIIYEADGQLMRGGSWQSRQDADRSAVLNCILGADNARVALGQQLIDQPERRPQCVPVTITPRSSVSEFRVATDAGEAAQETPVTEREDDPTHHLLCDNPNLITALDNCLAWVPHNGDDGMAFLELYWCLSSNQMAAIVTSEQGYAIIDQNSGRDLNERQEFSIIEMVHQGYLAVVDGRVKVTDKTIEAVTARSRTATERRKARRRCRPAANDDDDHAAEQCCCIRLRDSARWRMGGHD